MDFSDFCINCFSALDGQAQCPHCQWPAHVAPASPLHLPPRTFLKETYLLGRVLGHGGFGITYAAYEPALGRRLAIKEYLPNGEATRATGDREVHPLSGGAREAFDWGLEKFLEEARVLVRFQDHPGIVKVITFFPENGTAYLVMEHLIGQDFEAKLQAMGGRIGFPSVLLVMMPVVDALREVHKAGILHRDISPDNILLCDNRQIKLIDFGAARYAMSEKSRSLSILIKDGYAPEEQYRLKGKQGPWTDVYAVAATMYRAVAGVLPPTSLDRLHEDELKHPSHFGGTLSDSAWQVLQRGMALRAADRYASMEEFQADLLATEEARALVAQGLLAMRESAVVPPTRAPEKLPIPPSPEPIVLPTPTPVPPALRKYIRPAAFGLAAILVALSLYAWLKPREPETVAVVPPARTEEKTNPPDPTPQPPPENVPSPNAEPLPEPTPGPAPVPAPTPQPTPAPTPLPRPTPPSTSQFNPPSEPAPQPRPQTAPGFFQAIPPRIRAGQSAQLRWSIPSAQSATIGPGIGDVPSRGSLVVRPTETTTYELSYVGAAGGGGDPARGSYRFTVQVDGALPLREESPMRTGTSSQGRFLVRHDHQGTVTGVMGSVFGTNRARQIWPHCVGQLSVEGGRLIFRSQQQEHSFSIPLRSIEEVKANRFNLAGKKSFHVHVRGGEKYNFVPEQSVAELVDFLNDAIK